MTTILPHLSHPNAGLVFSRGTWWVLYSVQLIVPRRRKPPAAVLRRRRKSLATDDLVTARDRRDQWHREQIKRGAVAARRRGRPANDGI